MAARVRALLGDDRATPVAERPRLPDDVGVAARAVTGQPTPLQRLAARFPVRLDPGRRTAALVGVAVLIVAAVTGAWVLTDRPQAMAVGAAPTAKVPGSAPDSGAASSATTTSTGASGVPASAAPAATATSSSATVVVDVAGKVRRPGVYRLPSGSRIDDALHAAGGALPGVGLNSLNLAATVSDGQQIAVGITAAPAAAQPVASGGAAVAAGADGSASAGAPVDINTASLEQLQTLPGVGPVLAQHILDWRTAHRSFASVDQLDDVPGIGPVKFQALKPVVTV